MRTPISLLVLSMLALSLPVLAGPNAGGVIMLHTVEDLVWSEGYEFCGLSGLRDCESADVRVDGAGQSGFFLLAAFPPDANPRLSGVTFGIFYENSIVTVEHWQSCGDFELPDEAWPLPGSGNAVTWGVANTEHLVEVGWFAAYTYSELPSLFSLIDPPVKSAIFADDSVPSRLDDVVDFGALGFNTDGYNPCATAWDCTLELTPSIVAVYQPCGGSFPVGLRINDVEDLGLFEVCVGYDDAFLTFTDLVIDGSFLGSTGRTVVPWDPIVCSSSCQAAGIRAAANTSGWPDGPSGSGPLARIYFTPDAAGAGESSICLSAWELEDTEQLSNQIYVRDGLGIDVTHSAFCFGDFTGDGDVTVFDLARNIPCWGCCAGDERYDAIYDVNLLEPGNYCASTPDGCIDVVDIQTVAGRWHLGCPGAPGLSGDAPGGFSTLARQTSATGGGTPTLWISPESQVITGAAGDLASVELLVDGAVDLGAFEAEISFDPSVLQVDSVERGTFLESTGRTEYLFAPQVDNAGGVVRFGACTVGGTAGAEGGGDLAQIVFEIQDCDVGSDVAIQSVILTFTDGEAMELGTILDGSIQIDCDVSSAPTIPGSAGTRLFPSRPNPTTSSAEISFHISESVGSEVRAQLAIYDAAGRLVRTLVDQSFAPGTHVVAWDARDGSGHEVPNGAYFSRLRVGEESYREQLVVAR